MGPSGGHTTGTVDGTRRRVVDDLLVYVAAGAEVMDLPLADLIWLTMVY